MCDEKLKEKEYIYALHERIHTDGRPAWLRKGRNEMIWMFVQCRVYIKRNTIHKMSIVT